MHERRTGPCRNLRQLKQWITRARYSLDRIGGLLARVPTSVGYPDETTDPGASQRPHPSSPNASSANKGADGLVRGNRLEQGRAGP